MPTKPIKIFFDPSNNQQVAKAAEILAPLGITYFMYNFLHKNGHELKCTNRPDWIQYGLQNNLYERSRYIKEGRYSPEGFYLMSQLEHPEIMSLRAQQFNIDHIIVHIAHFEHGHEYFHWGSTADNTEITNFYLNNLPLLLRYRAYFKNHIAPQLEETDATLFKLSHHLSPGINKPEQPQQESEVLQQFKQATQIKRFELSGEYKGTYLTARELDCMTALARHLSIKGAAQAIALSPRTVESHLNNIKAKLNLGTKNQLIALAQQTLLDCYG